MLKNLADNMRLKRIEKDIQKCEKLIRELKARISCYLMANETHSKECTRDRYELASQKMLLKLYNRRKDEILLKDVNERRCR